MWHFGAMVEWVNMAHGCFTFTHSMTPWPILFSSPRATSVTFNSQNSSLLFILSDTDDAAWEISMNIPAAKKKKKGKHLVHRKLCSVLICHAQCHSAEKMSRNITDLCAREKSYGKGLEPMKEFWLLKTSWKKIDEKMLKLLGAMCEPKVFVCWQGRNEFWQWRQWCFCVLKLSHNGILNLWWH